MYTINKYLKNIDKGKKDQLGNVHCMKNNKRGDLQKSDMSDSVGWSAEVWHVRLGRVIRGNVLLSLRNLARPSAQWSDSGIETLGPKHSEQISSNRQPHVASYFF